MPPRFHRVIWFWLWMGLGLAPASMATPAKVIHGADRFDLNYRATIPKITGSAQLWMPLARNGEFQKVSINGIAAPDGWKQAGDLSEQNTIFMMPLTAADSGKAIEVRYTVERMEKPSYPATGDTSQYLKPDRLVPRSDLFGSLAKKIIAGKTGALVQGRALYNYVLGQMKYDKTGTGWGRGDAMYACSAKKGNCTDFHSLFIALARAAGIPARFAIGFTIPTATDSGSINGYHCWAEFLADGKWVPVDISEAWKDPALAGYYFGHQPANRVEFTRGRDLKLKPAPASGPVNFLIYPLIEDEGSPVAAETQITFHRLRS